MRLCLAISILLVFGCSACASQSSAVPAASVLASGTYPGGHYLLQPDNSLRVLSNWEELTIGTDAQEGPRRSYGQRPGQAPNMEILADRELLQGHNGWLGTCRRDGYIECWSDEFQASGFSRFGEQGADPGLWMDSQYPVTESMLMLDGLVLSTARNQELRAVDYDGRERWSFLMGAPARLLYEPAAGLARAASDDGYLYALDMQGQLSWQQRTLDHHAALCGGKLACLARDGSIACLDMQGQTLWQLPTEGVVSELRGGSELFWWIEAGRPRVCTPDGQPRLIDWPAGELQARDLLPGPDGDVFISAFDAQAASSGLHFDDARDAVGQLLCYSASGQLRWVHAELHNGANLLPAHNAQCWLVNLNAFAPVTDTLLLIGQPMDSQSS